MSVETARRRLWRAAGDSEQGTFVGCISVSDISEPWFLASCPFLILKDALMQGAILQRFLPNWVYLLPCFYEDRQTWGPVRRHQLCFRRRAKWGKCLARSVNLISVSIFLLNVRAWEGAGIQSRAFIKPYTEDTLAWSSYTDLFLYSAQVPCPLAVMSCHQNLKQCQPPPKCPLKNPAQCRPPAPVAALWGQSCPQSLWQLLPDTTCTTDSTNVGTMALTLVTECEWSGRVEGRRGSNLWKSNTNHTCWRVSKG